MDYDSERRIGETGRRVDWSNGREKIEECGENFRPNDNWKLQRVYFMYVFSVQVIYTCISMSLLSLFELLFQNFTSVVSVCTRIVHMGF